MTISYTYAPKFSIRSSSKTYPKCYFWYANIPSGNPDPTTAVFTFTAPVSFYSLADVDTSKIVNRKSKAIVFERVRILRIFQNVEKN
jgi:hypothetical protein